MLSEHTDFFVSWGTLALINAGLVQAKNRSGLIWWLVSLLLDPPGNLIDRSVAAARMS